MEKERIDQLYQTMKKNASLVNEWNDRFMESCDKDSWSEIVLERSRVLHQVFDENEKVGKDFWDSLPPRLYGEDLDVLFDLMRRLHEESLYVVSFGLRLARLLLPYYEEKMDIGRMVFLNYFMGYANYLLFDRTLNVEGPSDWLQYFEKVTSYEAHYAEVEDDSYRCIFFQAYHNLIEYSSNYPTLKGHTREFHERAHSLWDSEAVQALDGNNSLIKSKLVSLDAQYLRTLTLNPDLIDNAEEYCALAEQSLKKIGRVNIKSDPTGIHKLMECNVKRLKKQSSDEACVIALSDYVIKAIPPLNFDKKDDSKTFQLLMNEHTTFLYALKLLHTLPAEKSHLLDNALLRLLEDDKRIPYNFYPEEFNWTFYSLYPMAEPHMRNTEDKMNFLMNMILCRQPRTYIHSLMVTKLALMIGETVLSKKPELFVGLPGYPTLDSVTSNKEALLATIEKSGMLHDIGKCRVAIVINAQDRKLTENEFGILKHHPQMGAKLLESSEEFKPYVDVVLGHHKTYNGDGYPAQFDNISSSVRILIDLITIADCTDAATDILGRNYAQGKDFEKLLDELKQGAGTRYHPDLVQLIEQNKDLQDKISFLTSKGRLSLYQETCVSITNMHKKN